MLGNKGVTLVEILISLVISAVIMTYGISFFIGAARKGSLSAEYEFALQEAKNTIEEQISTENNWGGDRHYATDMRTAGFLGDASIRFNISYKQSKYNMGAYLSQLRDTTLVASWPETVVEAQRKAIIIQVRMASPYVRR
jgi:prepilin-type N-terminal cleavage/methylation domain-containing protein